MVKKVLFVGMGSIGCRNLNNLKKLLPSSEIAALRSQKNNIKNNCGKLIDYEFYNLKDAKKYSPDIVFITNPTSLHVEMALEFVNEVSGIFIEKPVSDNVENVNELINKNEITIFHVACPLRFHPAVKFIKKHVEDYATIFQLKIVSGSYLPQWRPEQDYRELYCAKKELGGGVSLDLIHEIDYMRWIFGDIKKGYFGSSKISNLEIDTEDVANGIWKLKNGILCEIHLDYFRKIPERYLEISSENAVIFLDLINSSVNIFNDGKKEKINFEFNRNEMYTNEISYFLNCVNKGKKSFNDLSFALGTLKYALYMRDNAGIVNL